MAVRNGGSLPGACSGAAGSTDGGGQARDRDEEPGRLGVGACSEPTRGQRRAAQSARRAGARGQRRLLSPPSASYVGKGDRGTRPSGTTARSSPGAGSVGSGRKPPSTQPCWRPGESVRDLSPTSSRLQSPRSGVVLRKADPTVNKPSRPPRTWGDSARCPDPSPCWRTFQADVSPYLLSFTVTDSPHRSRRNAGGLCARGHLLTPENLYTDGASDPKCRLCAETALRPPAEGYTEAVRRAAEQREAVKKRCARCGSIPRTSEDPEVDLGQLRFPGLPSLDDECPACSASLLDGRPRGQRRES